MSNTKSTRSNAAYRAIGKGWRSALQALIALCAVVLLMLPAASAQAEIGIGNNAVGVNAHIATQAFVDAVDDLDAGWIRLDGNWWTLEPSAGNFHWGPLDDAVTRSQDAGLNTLITFAYTPQWVPSSGTDGNFISNVPHSSTEWEDFLSEAIPRYRAMGVRHFSVWNEPNLEQFFNGTVDEYIDTILIPGAAAIRDVCADCVVVGPHLSHSDRQVDDYLRDIFDQAGTDIFDIIAHHGYYGFTDSGSNLWDRRFVNILDEPCEIPFMECADPLRDVLDEVGYTGEVWMAETGYRATPGDSEDEENQAAYITRVLEEQLERDWYTNTFFYEINDCGPDQPECQIDGFGLMRPTSGTHGSRSFPNDFRLKPAFDALRDFIADNSELTADPAPSEPSAEISAYQNSNIVVDGDLSDFGDMGWDSLDTTDWVGIDGSPAEDVDVHFAARWSSDALYLGVEVDHDEHHNDFSEDQLWQGDSLQVAFDIGGDGGFEYDDVDDHEFGFALSNGDVVAHRFHGPWAATDDWEVEIQRVGETTIYEIEFSPESLGMPAFSTDQEFGFSFLVNVTDGSQRLGWVELTPGIGASKAPEHFARLLLDGAVSEGDVEDEEDQQEQDDTDNQDTTNEDDIDEEDEYDEDEDTPDTDPSDTAEDSEQDDASAEDNDDGGDDGDGSETDDLSTADHADPSNEPSTGGEEASSCSTTGGSPQGTLFGLLIVLACVLMLRTRRQQVSSETLV